MKLRKAELRSFNSGNYTATIRIAGGYKVYLEDLSVARNLATAEMVPSPPHTTNIRKW